jgi:hypothetical protein
MEKLLEPYGRAPLDLDHAITNDGRIYRVVGNLDSRTHFLGYNVYSPDANGDRRYREIRYKKNLIEDDHLPADVLDIYKLVPIRDIEEHHDPVQSAIAKAGTFSSTIWFDLYTELARIIGRESVGIFGSSMFGLHLTPEGNIRKDIDFVIQGLTNIEILRQQLPRIRESLGFTRVTTERQLRQYDRYRRVFRNENNSIQSIIARRWTGLQSSEGVVTTIRLRDPTFTIPLELVTRAAESHDVIISGHVAEADSSNLFPRKFSLVTADGHLDIYILWWKFSTPVRDGDTVTLCGSIISVKKSAIIRLTDYSQHWLRIDD